MKKVFVINILVAMIVTSCAPSHEVTNTQKSVFTSKETLGFNPKEQVEKTAGINVTVMPVDAADLNRITHNAATRRGNYEREVTRTLTAAESDSDVKDSERKKLDLISRSINDGSFPADVGYHLAQLISRSSHGFDGSEEVWYGSMQGYTNEYNPFYVDGNYLSVFRLNFENESDEVQTIGISNFQIASGHEVNYPRKMAFFEDRFGGRVLDNAQRYNMPDELNILPGQQVEKFLAVPALSQSANEVSVQFIGEDNESASFQFEMEFKREREEKLLSEYEIFQYQTTEHDYFFNAYYALKLNDGVIIPLKSDNYYLDDDRAEENVNVCALIEYPRHDYKYLTCMDIRHSSYADNRIPLVIRSPL